MLSRLFIMTFLMIVVNLCKIPLLASPVEAKSATSALDEGCLEDEPTPKAESDSVLTKALRFNDKLQVKSSGRFETYSWLAFPKFSGRSILTGEVHKISPEDQEGAIVLAFVASWCIPCQRLVPLLQKLEEKYKGKYTSFYYIFGHDTKSDAQGFVREYKLGETALYGSAELLETFKQPELPTLYVRDRYKWMINRYRRPCMKHLEAIDSFLEKHTAF